MDKPSQTHQELLLSVPSPLFKQVETLISNGAFANWPTWDYVAMSSIHYIIKLDSRTDYMNRLREEIKSSMGKVAINPSGLEYPILVHIFQSDFEALGDLHRTMPEIVPLDQMLLGSTQMLADKLAERKKE